MYAFIHGHTLVASKQIFKPEISCTLKLVYLLYLGLQLAEMFNFPDSILKEAKKVAEKIKEVKKATDATTSIKQRKENANYK